MSHSPSQGSENVAFIGLGNLGYPMATNLSKWLHSNGYPALTVWTRNQSKAEKFASEHSEYKVGCASSLQEIVQSCDVIITSLANDAAAEEVYSIFEAALKDLHSSSSSTTTLSPHPIRSKYFIDTSTLYPTFVGSLERRLTSPSLSLPGRSISFVSAPVFGPPPLAITAQLIVCMSGTRRASELARRILVPSIGRKTIECGADVERAAKLKLCGNAMVLGVVEMLAEGLTLADKSDVGAELLFEFVKEFLPTKSYLGYGAKMVGNEFESQGGFTLTGGLKDAKHIKDMAAEYRSPMPMTDIAYNHLLTAVAHSERPEAKDWSALVAGPRLSAGLLPFSRDELMWKRLQGDHARFK